MEWLDHFNNSIAYVEENLAAEINLDRATISSMLQLSLSADVFLYCWCNVGRIHSPPEDESAGVDLQRGEKVIDVAAKYGYDSPTSFNRVFKACTESHLRKPSNQA